MTSARAVDDSAVSPEPDLSAIAAFIRRIGIALRFDDLPGPTVVPGVAVVTGGMVIDRARLECEGDILHEAGHLAVMTAAERATAGGTLSSDPASEMAAIAWSFAAASELGLTSQRLFHAGGYRGGAQAMIDAFEGGAEIGVPMLRWYGLCAPRGEEPAYPAMRRWMRE